MALLAFFAMTRDRERPDTDPSASAPSAQLPRHFWIFTTGVALFGVGDFSRTFLIFLAPAAFGGQTGSASDGVSIAVLLYAAHNAVSAIAAYPAGARGDRGSKLRMLIVGYGLGVVTNVMLAFSFGVPSLLVLTIVLSGTYIAIEETLERLSRPKCSAHPAQPGPSHASLGRCDR